MAKTLSSLENKENTHFKIFNFYIKKKTVFIVAGILVVLIIIAKYKSYQAEKELEERMLMASVTVDEAPAEETEVLSIDEMIQRNLREKYGEPAEGFEWDMMGNLVPLSNIEDASAEDIVYTYLESLHMMDFATAQRVAAKSAVIDTFDNYYSDISNSLVNTTDMFKRDVLRLALDSLKIEGITNNIVKADGTNIFTVEVTCLDLTNKDFWRDDALDIYQTIYVYDKTETDSTKKEQFIYDYIRDAYEKQLCGFRTTTVDIVVSKANSGGWLVTDDTPLKRLLLYEDGVSVADYINLQYTDWLINDGGVVGENTSSDVGFSHASVPYDSEEVQSAKKGYNTTKEDVENQKLQEELEYYKEHGELPPKDYKKDSSSEDTTEEGESSDSSETSDTEETEETESEEEDIPQEHSVTKSEEVGYGHATN